MLKIHFIKINPSLKSPTARDKYQFKNKNSNQNKNFDSFVFIFVLIHNKLYFLVTFFSSLYAEYSQMNYTKRHPTQMSKCDSTMVNIYW